MPLYDAIVGLDLSLTNTGMAAIRYAGNKWATSGILSSKEHTKNLTDPLRQLVILSLVRNFIREHKPSAVVIEDYAFGQRNGKFATRAELGGMVKYLILVEFGLPVYLVAPTAVKRLMDCADKKKRGDKEAMFDAAYKKYNFVNTDDNIVDAYCLARYLVANKEGQQLTLVRLSPLPQYRVIPVQAPAPKKLPVITKNRLLTIPASGTRLKPFRRIPLKQ